MVFALARPITHIALARLPMLSVVSMFNALIRTNAKLAMYCQQWRLMFAILMVQHKQVVLLDKHALLVADV